MIYTVNFCCYAETYLVLTLIDFTNHQITLDSIASINNYKRLYRHL